MTPEWAAAVREAVSGWPDEQEKADERKTPTYWAYIDRKRESFDGVFALGVRGIPGADAPQYLALTFGADGACTGAEIVSGPEALSAVKLAVDCDYQTWLDMASGYDIGKAMTYHKLPLRAGSTADLLRCVYFVHELIVAALRPEASLPGAVPA